MQNTSLNELLGIIWCEYVFLRKLSENRKFSDSELLKKIRLISYPHSVRKGYFYKLWLRAIKITQNKLARKNYINLTHNTDDRQMVIPY